MKRLALIVFSSWAALAQADAPLPGDIIQDLNALQGSLASAEGEQALESVIERAQRQAERLESGNRSDQWASALYDQLAAGALSRQGENSAAADRLERARSRSSVGAEQASRWLRQEAQLRRAAGQRAQAIGLYQQWLDDQSDRDMSWQLVRLLADDAQWEAAAERLTPLLTEGEPESDARQALALGVMRRAGRGEQALGWLVEDLSEQSGSNAWRQAAGLAQQAGQAGLAAGLWETAWQLGIFDSNEDFDTLVELHLAGGTPARAAEHLERALEEGRLTDDEATLRRLAQVWYQARAIEKALDSWQALAEASQQSEDWRRYGQLAYAWGEEARAESAWETAQALGDNEVDAWLANLR
ncbi:tetratricopeptide repeat protein [Halomonas sp. HNIBRBA4712]|uniref:tetratricopeptide repeat protein n=1 Tax=Halomonas sp. HNIBRBA4712 TaxID=3373087 RepID=UPI003747476E